MHMLRVFKLNTLHLLLSSFIGYLTSVNCTEFGQLGSLRVCLLQKMPLYYDIRTIMFYCLIVLFFGNKVQCKYKNVNER